MMSDKQYCERCGEEATRVALAIVQRLGAVEPGQVTGCVSSAPACGAHEAELQLVVERRAQEQFDRDLPKFKARRELAQRADALKKELHDMERDYKKKGAMDNPNVPAAYALHKDFVERYNRFKQAWDQMEAELAKALGD